MLTLTQQNILEEYGERITRQLRDVLREQSASGELVDSIRYEADEKGLRIYAAEHFEEATFGRAPGKFPPKKAIKDWIEDKGLTFGSDMDSAVFLIQRTIAEKGTKAWREKKNSVVKNILTDDLPKKIGDELAADISESLVNDILKTFKAKA